MAKPITNYQKLNERRWRFATDGDTGARYTDAYGLRFFDNGRIEVADYFHNRPEARLAVSRYLGVQVFLLNEVRGRELITPEGMKVAKAWLDSSVPLLWDKDFNMVVFAGHHWGSKLRLTYPHPNAQPVPHENIRIRKPNKKAAAAVMGAVLDAHTVALAKRKMGVFDRGYASCINDNAFYKGEVANISARDEQFIAWQPKEAVEKAVKYHTSDVTEVPYLKFI